MAAVSVGAAEQLQARDFLQQLVEFVARRLLDLPPPDPLDCIDALGLGLRERGARDDDRRLRRIWRKRLRHKTGLSSA
jgi:hypothetical protein